MSVRIPDSADEHDCTSEFVSEFGLDVPAREFGRDVPARELGRDVPDKTKVKQSQIST